MDSDMIVMRNMDELMDIVLPDDWIAACHACACNPRKLKHYPADWLVTSDEFSPTRHVYVYRSGSPQTVLTPLWFTQTRSVIHLTSQTPAHVLMDCSTPD